MPPSSSDPSDDDPEMDTSLFFLLRAWYLPAKPSFRFPDIPIVADSPGTEAIDSAKLKSRVPCVSLYYWREEECSHFCLFSYFLYVE